MDENTLAAIGLVVVVGALCVSVGVGFLFGAAVAFLLFGVFVLIIAGLAFNHEAKKAHAIRQEDR